MILNLGSLAFNANIAGGGGTPAWGTELGQGEGYKFTFEDMSDFFTGMVYSSVADLDNVTCPLGKGGSARNDYDFVIASVFNKIYVNDIRVDDAQFLLLVIKKLVGDHHVGRRTIKYNPRMTYRGKEINADCYKKMEHAIGLTEDSAWFVHEIKICNQDELHFYAYELGDKPIDYISNDERKNAFLSKLPKDGTRKYFEKINNAFLPLQQIYYGAPGTGKSHAINEKTKTQPQENVFRTTFHPDSDYSTFVGCYKPTMKENIISKNGVESKEEQIIYSFTPQAFTRAYVQAWKNLEKDVFLIIEEINRGNCAQIFGDLFQLLDRGDDGKSDYSIDADSDLRQHLENELGTESEGIKNGKLRLPSNLHIWATMNTSDQSLFPIDSAFKRRWLWKYIPIANAGLNYKIQIGDKKYDWWTFIEKVNNEIEGATKSEDKKLGYFFAKAQDGIISAETFVSKVVFYLWNDVFKDSFDKTIFKNDITFHKFFESDGSPKSTIIEQFMKDLDIKADGEENTIAETTE